MKGTELISELLLPKEIHIYFDVTKIEKTEEKIEIYLEERNEIPDVYDKNNYESNGFHKEISVQDFPLRGKALYLLIKRRRWRHKETGQVIERDWHLVATGTRITQEFAAFLKEFDRYKNRHNK